jgi:methyltransferase-like protein
MPIKIAQLIDTLHDPDNFNLTNLSEYLKQMLSHSHTALTAENYKTVTEIYSENTSNMLGLQFIPYVVTHFCCMGSDDYIRSTVHYYD